MIIPRNDDEKDVKRVYICVDTAKGAALGYRRMTQEMAAATEDAMRGTPDFQACEWQPCEDLGDLDTIPDWDAESGPLDSVLENHFGFMRRILKQYDEAAARGFRLPGEATPGEAVAGKSPRRRARRPQRPGTRIIEGQDLHRLCEWAHSKHMGVEAELYEARAELRAKAVANYLSHADDEALQQECDDLLSHVQLLEIVKAALEPFWEIYTTWDEAAPDRWNRADAALTTADAVVLVVQQAYLTYRHNLLAGRDG